MQAQDRETPTVDRPTTNVLVVGVGGQGVIMVSKVLARLCQLQGYVVKQSEVHGMAKRGGAVFSHVRYGDRIWSPTIPKGQVDILLALEWAEGLRWLDHLRSGSGTFIADTQQIVPPFACLDRKRGAAVAYSRETPAEVIEKVGEGFALDATRVATELGNARAANTMLLGALSTALDFAEDDWLDVILEFVPPKTREVNRAAFLKGREWIVETRDHPSRTSAASTALAARAAPPEDFAADSEITLRITPEWCKGCDICVKMCPERCLVLDERQVVELKYPDRCTGCRLCEWLCPDFAIDVERVSVGREEVNA